MGRLMGSSNSNNYGEQIFINKASEYLDDTNIICLFVSGVLIDMVKQKLVV